MATLSVDLAYKSFADIGAVILRSASDSIDCRLMQIQGQDVPTPPVLAEYLDWVCRREGIRTLMLDGPQGWKSSETELIHARRCERELNTPAKTGLPGFVKPVPYLSFVRFCIATYDALADLGWRRLSAVGVNSNEPLLVETFPLSAWRLLGLPALRAKKKAKPEHKTACLEGLRELFPLRLDGDPGHDQLQALVAGLAGLAIERGEWGACVFSGASPVVEDGLWREGWIVNRKRP